MPQPEPRNGTAPSLIPHRRRLHVVPQTREYEVERSGEDAILTGYVAGPSCPISVTIEVQAAIDEYNEANQKIGPKSQRLSAWITPALRQRQAILCAVVRGLTEDEAAILSADGGDWEAILVELGWWKKDAATTEDDADPEAMGETALTSDASSPAPVSIFQELISST